jgi:hypothetical protein
LALIVLLYFVIKIFQEIISIVSSLLLHQGTIRIAKWKFGLPLCRQFWPTALIRQSGYPVCWAFQIYAKFGWQFCNLLNGQGKQSKITEKWAISQKNGLLKCASILQVRREEMNWISTVDAY